MRYFLTPLISLSYYSLFLLVSSTCFLSYTYRSHVFYSLLFFFDFITFLFILHFSHASFLIFFPSVSLSHLYLLYLRPFYPSLMCRHSFSSFIFPSHWPPSPLFIANNILGSLLTLFTFTRFSLYYLYSVSCIHLPILTLLPPSCLLYLLLLPSRSFFLRSLFSHALTEPILSSFSSVSRQSISLSRHPLLVSLRSTETE